MSYMDRLKAKIAETHYPNEPTKPPEPSFVGFEGDPGRQILEKCVSSLPRQNDAPTGIQVQLTASPETFCNQNSQLLWREGIASLDPEKPRGGFHWRRWDHLVADCVLIFNEYGEQAAATGWTAEDLFGVDPSGASGTIVGGLAWRLEGRKLLTVEVGIATFAYRNGEIGRCSRGWIRGLVPVWELEGKS
ncbi:hypothetical protein [Sphingobium phenoxybenzoativorans]|uniref:hypothetical protein n=1 Tax=Sphingobium phenoxybenzoativorans TaxID=1592790 RepID=UPI001112EC83|nr:hypothetical protein [Sphingobium phenoxybenzoativorans]